MFNKFDDLRDFALTFVDKMVLGAYIPSDIDSDNEDEFDIQDMLVEHYIHKTQQNDCVIPNQGTSYCITDIHLDYMVAFIESEAIPLGLFTIFTDEENLDEDGEPKIYVNINFKRVYLD